MTEKQTALPTDRGLVTETIAVLGAGGTMGFPIARNIARAGLPARVWNRSGGKAEPLTADGAYLTRTPEEAASGAGIVITMWLTRTPSSRRWTARTAPWEHCQATTREAAPRPATPTARTMPCGCR